ncbi:hypothetical protein HY489_03650 [Candidatus Woesearchaeota archaeon]|nr:hypothetical protein [Candidatus Woesearchaeota archaeon]
MHWTRRFFAKKLSLEGVRSWLQSEQGQGLDAVQACVDALDDLAKVQASVEQQRSLLLSQREEVVSRRDAALREKEQVAQHDDFASMKEALRSAVSDRKAVELEIKGVFSPLQDALLQHSREVRDGLLEVYASDPSSALARDFNLAVLKHIPALRLRLGNSVALDSLSKEVLGKLVHRFANARRSESRLLQQLEQSPVFMEYDVRVRSLKSVDDELRVIDEDIARCVVPDANELRLQLSVELEKFGIVLI